MSVSVRIPTTLRTLTSGKSEVALDGSTVRDVLGNLRRFVNVFVADDDIRFLDGLDTAVPDGETVSIIPAVAGG